MAAAVDRLNRVVARGGTNPPDAALALVAIALVIGDLDYTGVHPALAITVVLPAIASLAWRRRAPVPVAVAVCSADLVLSLASTNLYGSQLADIAVVLAVYTVASRCDGRAVLAGGALTLPLVVAAHVATEGGDYVGDFIAVLLWSGGWLAGRVVRRRTLEAARLATEATQRAQRREDEARDAVGRERDRIARELHDVVAHAVSLVVVQAGAERLSLGTASPRTRAALEAIESTGRQALVELRAMLGVLRDDNETDDGLTPQPDLDSLPGLVERVRAAGLPVEVDIVVTDSVPAGVALSAYRIVQEALTNVLKHSPTSADVTLRTEAAQVEVEVRNPIDPTTRADIGTGRGLVGMRERAALHGGALVSGAESGTWVVRATLPFTPTPATAPARVAAT